MADLFDELVEVPPPPAEVEGCGRRGCISSGLGNICFFSDAALREYCRDQAKRKLRSLAVEFARLPIDQRTYRLERLSLKGWSPAVVEWLARRAHSLALERAA